MSRHEAVNGNRSSMVVICGATMLLYAVYLGAFGVILPIVSREFGLGTAASGRLFPANFGGFVFGVLASGVASDRVGRKAILLLSLGLYALGLLLFNQAAAMMALLAAAAMVGAGNGGMITMASALASDLYPERRSTVLNAINIAFGVGAAGGPYLAHQLIQSGIGWRTQCFGLACVTVLLGAAAMLARRPSPPAPLPDSLLGARRSRPEEQGEGRQPRIGSPGLRSGEAARSLEERSAPESFLRRPEFLLLCVMQAVYAGTEVGFFTRLPTYFRAQFAEGGDWEGTIVTVFWVAMTVGRFAVEPVLRRVVLLKVNRFLAVGTACGIVATLAAPSPLLAAVGVAFTGFVLAGVMVIHFTETGNRFPEGTGTIFSGVVAAGGIGASLLPWTISAMAETSLGWRGALGLLLFSSLSIAPLSLWLERLPVRASQKA